MNKHRLLRERFKLLKVNFRPWLFKSFHRGREGVRLLCCAATGVNLNYRNYGRIAANDHRVADGDYKGKPACSTTRFGHVVAEWRHSLDFCDLEHLSLDRACYFIAIYITPWVTEIQSHFSCLTLINWICCDSCFLLQQCFNLRLYRSGYLGHLKVNLSSENGTKKASNTSVFLISLVTRFPQLSELYSPQHPLHCQCIHKNLYRVHLPQLVSTPDELWFTQIHSCMCKWCLFIPLKFFFLPSAYFLSVSELRLRLHALPCSPGTLAPFSAHWNGLLLCSGEVVPVNQPLTLPSRPGQFPLITGKDWLEDFLKLPEEGLICFFFLFGRSETNT